MSYLGNGSLYLALAFSVYALIAALRGLQKNERALKHSRWANLASFSFVCSASACLVWAFLSDDFRLAYVARHSERSLAPIFKISAFWAGQAGSLLLWLLLLSALASVVQLHRSYRKNELGCKAGILINIMRSLFLLLLLLVTPPFQKAEVLAFDGSGLNPMLQSLGMVVHPPLLFLGFSGFLIPFSFLAAELWERNEAANWLQLSRPWVLFSWTLLSMGIVTGGQWAYNELGWGGYWAWDPVENASLLPWLTSTALLHCLKLPPQKRESKLWAAALILLTFLLTIFGTFLTRSGILDSVHAFASGLVGQLFLIILGILTIFSLYLALTRFSLLDREKTGKSEKTRWNSREQAIQIGAVILLLLFSTVFLGTLFPLFSRTFLQREMVLDEAFFNQVTVPLFLALFVLLALTPLLGKRGANLKTKILLPGLAGTCALIFSYFKKGAPLLAGAAFAIAAWGLTAHLQDLLSNFNYKRVGTFLAHGGILLMLVGVTGSSVFVQEVFQTVEPGGQLEIGAYSLEYPGLTVQWGISQYSVSTALEVFRNGRHLGQISSSKTFTQQRSQPASKIGIFSTLREDLYFNLAGWQDQAAQLQLHTFALVIWIWIGSVLLYLGAALNLVLKGGGN